jgi:hypothetical protein
MTIFLGDQFFRAVQSSPIEHEYAGRKLTVAASGPDLLQVRDDAGPLAYITRYSESESGILPAGRPLDILAPLFHTLDDALDSITLRG